MAATDNDKHIDRRIVRTRRAIHSAFLNLLTEHDYDKITITALAKKANIDRKTFYAHYSSIDELFEDIVRARMERSQSEVTIDDLLNDPSHCAKRYLYALEATLPLSKQQRAEILEHIPLEKFIRYSTNVARERIYGNYQDLSDELKRYISFVAEFYLGGLFQAYAFWLAENIDLTLDEVIEIIGINMAGGLSGMMENHIIPMRSGKH